MSDDPPVGRRPGSVLATAGVGCAAATVVLAGPVATVPLLATAAGAVGVTVGLSLSARRAVGVGALALLGGVLAAGVSGLATIRLLAATTTGSLVGPFALGSLDARTELRDGAAPRTEPLQVCSAVAAAAVVAAATYAFSAVVTVSASTLGVTLLLVAVVAFGVALRE